MHKEKDEIRKKNTRLFSIYKGLSWDYLFFYTINFLFFTQVKNINPADVVLVDSFYYLFVVLAQIPSTVVIEFLGRKNSIIVGNILNCIYMVIIIFSKNIFNLMFAEFISSLAFGIKGSAEPTLLNESIPNIKQKSEIFAKINEKGISNYYLLNGISIVIAGIFFQINPYIPIIMSLLVLVLVTLISMVFIEPVKQPEKIEERLNFSEISEALKYIIQSERLKGLIVFSTVMTALLCILKDYEISILNDLKISSSALGILVAVLGVISSLGTKDQESFNKKHKNNSLAVIGYVISVMCILAGIFGEVSENYKLAIIFLVIVYAIKYVYTGLYYALIERYMRNFTNEEIDTKIFAVNNAIRGIFSAFSGIMAAFLLDRMKTSYCMIIVGWLFLIMMILVKKYMKTRVGLKPEEYPSEEIKYDTLPN